MILGEPYVRPEASSRHFTINTIWLELSLTALDLLAWMRTLLLEGELAAAEPKKLRYQLLLNAFQIAFDGRLTPTDHR